MVFREATTADIKQIQVVRNIVKENVLPDPSMVTDDDCLEYMTVRGKGWVCEAGRQIIAFAIVDLQGRNVWAMFLDPSFQGRGIGRVLHEMMLDWYFEQTPEPIWLGTAPGTRAVGFYKRAGWKEAGMHGSEIKFEMSHSAWAAHQSLRGY